MWIRLTRKLAEQLDGIDLSAYKQGDVFELPRYEAELLIAEEWAVPSNDPLRCAVGRGRTAPQLLPTTTASSNRRTVEQLRRLRDALALKQDEEQARRRAEDRIREELHDARAKTIRGVVTADDAEGS